MSVKRPITYATGATVQIALRDFSTGAELLWNTATPGYEAYNASNAAHYGIAASESTNSPGSYTWVVPATLPASAVGYEYEATAYVTATSTFAITDLPNSIGLDTFAWDGALPTISRGILNIIPGNAGGFATVDGNNNVHGLQTRTVSDTSVIGTSTFAGGAVASVTGNVGGSVVGDVQGKVQGGGNSPITGIGAQAFPAPSDDPSKVIRF